MHIATVAAMAALWHVAALPPLYVVGVVFVAVLLTYEQSLVHEGDLSKVKMAFDLNGYVGIVYFTVTALALFIE
jgi:4-hydroxybenzoate polyprenyltransferase